MGDLIPLHPPRSTRPEPLWREVVGHELRAERQSQERTLADVAGVAGISVQYLSEVERGRKEPSSEVLGAIHTALGLRLVDLTARTTQTLSSRPTGPVALAVWPLVEPRAQRATSRPDVETCWAPRPPHRVSTSGLAALLDHRGHRLRLSSTASARP